MCDVCLTGDFHHENRAAGVFVPGQATGTLKDAILTSSPNEQNSSMTQEELELLRAPTLDLGNSPTPKRLRLTPCPSEKSLEAPASCTQTLPDAAPAVIDIKETPPVPVPDTKPETQQPDTKPDAQEPNTPMESFPDAQPRDLSPPPSQPRGPSPPPSQPNQVPANGTQGSNIPVTPQGPRSDTPPTRPAKAAPSNNTQKQAIILEGTMYTDGTYWKTLCCSEISCMQLGLILRMDRFMKAHAKGKVKATPEIIQYWKNPHGRGLSYNTPQLS